VTVNVSSPNTPGLRGLQNKEALTRLLGALTDARKTKVPLLLKIAPDLDGHAWTDIADTVRASGIEGLIVSNTLSRAPVAEIPRRAGESGGLSGKPLFAPSTEILRPDSPAAGKFCHSHRCGRCFFGRGRLCQNSRRRFRWYSFLHRASL